MRSWPALALAGCSILEPPADRAPPPDLALTGVTLEQYRHGALDARAHLTELRYQRDASRALATDLRVTPLQDGRPDGVLTAATADAQLRRGHVQLAGGVTYVTSAGDRMETATSELDLLRRRATGPDAVHAEGPGYALDAAGYEAHFGSEPRVEFSGGVKARVLPPKAPEPTPRPKRRGARR